MKKNLYLYIADCLNEEIGYNNGKRRDNVYLLRKVSSVKFYFGLYEAEEVESIKS